MMGGQPVALVVGATGLAGSYLAKRLRNEGWTILTLSRGAAAPDNSDRHFSIDLTDRSQALAQLGLVREVSHVFFCTWSRQVSEVENVRVNGGMLQNLLDGLVNSPIRHVGLVTGLKHYLGSHEDYLKSPPPTPFRENQPRGSGLNFYYAQEDILFADARARGYSWSVHRPNTLIGVAVGNAMNMAMTIAVYASICRHTGQPFIFPGSARQYEAIADVTDADVLAEQLVWAAQAPAAANTAFNVTSGDVFRWDWMWRRLADYFHLPVPPRPVTRTPLVTAMANADPIWRDLVRSTDIVDTELGRLATWWHTDLNLSRDRDCFADLGNSRALRFAGYKPADQSFFDVFDKMQESRLIPAITAR